MTISLVGPGDEDAGIVALNVRAFHDIDYEKIEIRYANMKDEGPKYDVDEMPKW